MRHPTIGTFCADFMTVGAENVHAAISIGTAAPDRSPLIGVTTDVDQIMQVEDEFANTFDFILFRCSNPVKPRWQMLLSVLM